MLSVKSAGDLFRFTRYTLGFGQQETRSHHVHTNHT